MERFKSLLQKLQEVYNGSQQKSAIDIDLMLDYTRVMYADLLEWRKEFTDPLRPQAPATPAAEVPTPAPVAKAEEPQPAPAAVTKAEEPQPAPQVEEEHDTAPGVTATAEPDAATEPAVTEPTPVVEAVQPEPEQVSIYPEKEDIDKLSLEHTGISYEPPFHPEKPVMVEHTLAEEMPVPPAPVVEDIPAPAPAEIPLPEFRPYEPAKLFDAIVERKDIRASVGINDKYLFLNELFNNHKSDYEETLDALNRQGSQEEAADWVRNKVAGPRKWDNEDPTVQSFYALIAKHFSAR